MEATSNAGKELSFDGMCALFVENGVLQVRLQIWRRKFESLGGRLEARVSNRLTHVFSNSVEALRERVDSTRLRKLRKLSVSFLAYNWLEDCLKAGTNVPAEPYNILQCGASAEEGSGGESGSDSLNSSEEDVPSNRFQPTTVQSERSNVQEKELYNPPNLNQKLTDSLQQLKDIYRDAFGDQRRAFSYQKAASTLEQLPFTVKSVDQVKMLPNIGKSMQEHIHEFLTSGKLSRLDHFKEDEQVKIVSLFGSVWGIGPATALKLYKKGHRSLEDLKHEPYLTSQQKIGLQYFHDLQERIPRNEVMEMEMIVQEAAMSLQPEITVQCGGSYRRGKATSGDIDLIITHPDGISHKGLLPRLVESLKEAGFLKEDLVIGYHEGVNEVDTYFGLCKNPHREQRHRIDFKVFSAVQFPFGLLAWTGNDVLNRRLRLKAEAKGYILDDTGLYRSMPDSKRHKVANRNTGVSCKTEREIFEFLDYQWLEPKERNL